MSGRATVEKLTTGAEILALDLEERGVKTVFCITGAGNLAILDAIEIRGKINLVYSHHEQAAVMEAQGYSRISGEVGVAIVTTGGGTSNSITGVLSAHLDSVPILIISGNESSFHCKNMANFRAFGTQGFDSVSVLSPITKNSVRLEVVEDLRTLLGTCWSEMGSGRPGPVHMDFPMDLQRRSVIGTISLRPVSSNRIADHSTQSIKAVVKKCAVAVSQARKPVFYFGNGIRRDGSRLAANRLSREYSVPYFLSWSAIDMFSDSDSLNVGRVGIYGDRAANIILQQADLLICVGTRLAIPQTGYDRNDFARNAIRWVIDIDEVELTKFEGEDWVKVCCDSELFLRLLEEELSEMNISAPGNWLEEIQQIWTELPRENQVGNRRVPDGNIHSIEVIEAINDNSDTDAIIATDVGAALLSGHYMLQSNGIKRIFTSQGLGEMGFGLPGAIGAYFAQPDRQIICLNTDGAIMFNLQELQLVAHHNIPLKLIVFNNCGYSMIKISQNNLFEGRLTGVNEDTGVSFPNFGDVASLFGFEHLTISRSADIDELMPRALSSDKAIMFEVMMDPSQTYLPRLATNKTKDGLLVSPPLEDLDPKIELGSLTQLLGTDPHPNSKAARGI